MAVTTERETKETKKGQDKIENTDGNCDRVATEGNNVMKEETVIEEISSVPNHVYNLKRINEVFHCNNEDILCAETKLKKE